MTRKSLLALALASALTAPAMADTINFDVDGPGGVYTPKATDAFDWLPGNALAKNSLPLNGGAACDELATPGSCGGQTFELIYQAELSDVSGSGYPGGSIALPTGSDTSFEITIAASITELLMMSPGGPIGVSAFKHLAGAFTMYYDDLTTTTGGGNADDVSTNETVGADYADGTPIMTGFLVPVGPLDALYTGLAVTTLPLDSYAANGLPGITTVSGIGSTGMQFLVSWAHPKWFPKPPTVVDVNLTSTLADPFTTINPSKQFFDGSVPKYGADGVNGLYTGGPAEDFHFQADASSNFSAKTEQIPEPASLALLGLGLAAMGFATRRRAA